MFTPSGQHAVGSRRYRPICPRGTLTVVALLALITGQACNTVSGPKYQKTQRQLQISQEKTEQLEKQVLEQSSQIQHLQDEAVRLRGLERQDYDQLIVPVKIKLEGHSGGYDTDGKPGDDGIVLYIQPIDADGHVIKAAGSLKVRLLDLSASTERMELAPYHFDVPTTRGLWYGRMWTHHWTVRCPWPPNKLPERDEITAHVEFTDLLTGRVLKTQEAFKVVLPVKKAGRDKK